MKYKYQENTYMVRGIPITIMEKIKVDNNGNEIYDAKVEQENDLKLYAKHKEMILEMLKIRNYYDECKRNVLKQLPNVKDVIFTNEDYSNINKTENAVIYCDIPYQNTTSYQSCKHFNHNNFWNWCREVSKNNIVLISELQAPDDFICIWEQNVLRSLNSKNKNKTIERLFIHKLSYDKIKGE